MKTTTTLAYTVLGYTETVTSCDCCGRADLKGTVALQDNETGEINYYGVVCGAKIARNTTREMKDAVSFIEKVNLINAGIEFRATKEYSDYNNYMEVSNLELDKIEDYDARYPLIKKRMELGGILREVKNKIAAKYFIKYTHKF